MKGPDELIGQNLGGYKIVEKLGAGGMAVVYKGYQESLGRYVAVKVLHEDLAGNQEFINRFRREALAVAGLSHPNVLHVYDAGHDRGRHYIVMDYVDGGSLKDLLENGPVSVEQAVGIASQMADALDAAHRRGLVHRDVKPGNILLSRDGHPVLTDFGIAKALYEATRLTHTGSAIGTPDYMAPEQLSTGQAVDGRTDIYALGIVLFEMLTGWAPFHAPTPMATLYKQMNELPPALSQVNVAIPSWLETAVNKALAKKPELRYQQASEFAAALRQRHGQGLASPTYVPVHSVTAYGPPPSVPPPVAPLPAGGADGISGSWDAGPYVPPPVAVERPAKRSAAIPILIAVIVLLFLGLAGGVAYMILEKGKGSTAEASPTAVETPPTAVVIVVPRATETVAPTVEAGETPSSTVQTGATPPEVTTETPPTSTGVVASTPTVMPTTAVPPTPTNTKPAPTKTTGPTAEPGVIADFESFGTWKRGDQANGTFTQSSAQVHQGSKSGKLDYQFGTAGNDYVIFQQAHALAGQPAYITAWVYGDGSGHFFNAWIKDKAGQVWQVPLGTVSSTGWQQMIGVLYAGQPWPWAHISGPDNGAIDYPVSFVALVLDDKPDTYSGSGTIYVDDLRADPDSIAAGLPPSGGSISAEQATALAATAIAAATAGGVAPGTVPGTTPGAIPAVTSAPATGSASGRIAYSAAGALHIAQATTGQDTVGPIANRRQPDFSADGQLIITNGEGGGQDSLWTVRTSDGSGAGQSTHPDDFHPYFFPADPGRFVYDTTMMGKGQHNLVVASLGNKPKEMNARSCLSYGPGLIIGEHPIWLSNDMIVYTGCDYGFGGGSSCGLYRVSSGGGVPVLLLAGSQTDRPSDGYGTQVLFTSQRDGNWELYLVNSNGSGLRNLSNSSGSNDGLGTFSPDGKTIAFVSNQGGPWAVWAINADGSNRRKLFNLPAPLTGTWTDERISWGP
jgi:hypothetical protein